MSAAAAPPALVLAAHGVRGTANEPVERLAGALRARGIAPVVDTAYHAGSPGFATVLGGLAGERVVVVPLFTSEGHYTAAVLPRALAASRARRPGVVITKPVGVHRAVPGLVASHLARAAGARLRLPGAVLVVVGHGTGRAPGSAGAAWALGRALVRRRTGALVRVAFLDQEPRLEAVVAECRGAPLVIFPFLLGAGRHAEADLPARARRAAGEGAGLTFAPAFGALPELPDLVASLYRRARREALA